MNNDTPKKYPVDEPESPNTPGPEQSPPIPDPEPDPIEKPESI